MWILQQLYALSVYKSSSSIIFSWSKLEILMYTFSRRLFKAWSDDTIWFRLFGTVVLHKELVASAVCSGRAFWETAGRLSRSVEPKFLLATQLSFGLVSLDWACRSFATRGGVFGLDGGESTSSFDSILMMETRFWDKAVRPDWPLCSLEVDRRFSLEVCNSLWFSLLVGKRRDVDSWPSKRTYLEGPYCRANEKSWLRSTKLDDVP